MLRESVEAAPDLAQQPLCKN